MLPASELGRINLPVLVRYALSEYCAGGSTGLTPTFDTGYGMGAGVGGGLLGAASRPSLKMFVSGDDVSLHCFLHCLDTCRVAVNDQETAKRILFQPILVLVVKKEL